MKLCGECKDCEHWTREVRTIETERQTLGVCGLPEITNAMMQVSAEPSSWSVNDGEDEDSGPVEVTVTTYEGFGCVQWKERH